jgi:hypothetical protein
MLNMGSLTDKVAMVTGSSKGIGLISRFSAAPIFCGTMEEREFAWGNVALCTSAEWELPSGPAAWRLGFWA